MKKIFLALTAALAILSSVSALADTEDVKVLLNNSPVDYASSGVYPQVINDYTMVPLRQTADLMGIDVVWNNDTRTMTLTKDGRVSKHVLYTNIVNINGVDKEYPAISANVSDKTLMPVRMIADVLNANVDWDGTNRTVKITSNVPAAPVAPVVQVAGGAAIESATLVKDTVMIGETAEIRVVANAQTTNVRLLKGSSNVITSETKFTDSAGKRIFTLRYSPTSPTIAPLRFVIQAGNGREFNTDNEKDVFISVIQGLYANSIYASNNNPYLNDAITITVTASENTTKVRLTNKTTGEVVSTQGSYTTNSNNLNVFQFQVDMKRKGDITFTVEVGNENTFIVDNDHTLTVTVQDARPTDPLAVKSVVVPSGYFSKYQTVTVDVWTSLSTDYVIIYNSKNQEMFRSQVVDSTTSDHKVFKADVSLDYDGTNDFTASAVSSSKSSSTNYSFTIRTNSSASGNSIISAKIVGQNDYYYAIEIYTTMDVTYVTVSTDSYMNPQTITSYTVDGNYQYKWVTNYIKDSIANGQYGNPYYDPGLFIIKAYNIYGTTDESILYTQ
ncbi:hypothetical protein AGMMS49975_07600 [Clostridia bacterium]|nr:hypothetical protein AGMMS49975_07600 [Clostridia bacterium]